jgi:hypothetical protein
MLTRPSYVEIPIAESVDDVWARTQDPDTNTRRDRRYTSLRYLDRPHPAAPQAFHYTKRLGLGPRIGGTGETTGQLPSTAERASALRFGSDERLSLIRVGAGYGKYIGEGDRFRS